MNFSRRFVVFAVMLLAACAHAPPTEPFAAGRSGDAPHASGGEPGEASHIGGDVRTYLHLRLPLFSEDAADAPVARVGDEIITVRNLVDALAASSTGHGEAGAHAGDFAPVIERLVSARLMLQEARAIGIPEQERAQATLQKYRETTELMFVRREIVAGIEADPAEVESRYSVAAQQWQVKSALFDSQDAARRAHDRIARGEPFDSVVAEAVAEGKARGGGEPRRVRRTDMLPEVLSQVEALQPGRLGPPLQLPRGVALLQVVAKEQADDSALRHEIEAEVLSEARAAAVSAVIEKLKRTDATINERRLRALDLGAPKPGVEALRSDTRVLAEIPGVAPLTVGDLVADLEQKYFHGANSRARHETLNADKLAAFDRLLGERLLLAEARRREIRMSEEYRNTVDDYTSSYLVGLFVQSVVNPEVKVMESEIRARYEANLKEFTTPEMLKLHSIAFASAAAASTARDMLSGGTELRWFLENGSGIAEKDALSLRGSTLALSSLEADLAAALAGADTGDCRLYDGPAGGHYVIYVERRVPPRVQDYRDAREVIAKALLTEKLERAAADWADKLRQAYPVTLYLTDLDTQNARGL